MSRHDRIARIVRRVIERCARELDGRPQLTPVPAIARATTTTPTPTSTPTRTRF